MSEKARLLSILAGARLARHEIGKFLADGLDEKMSEPVALGYRTAINLAWCAAQNYEGDLRSRAAAASNEEDDAQDND